MRARPGGGAAGSVVPGPQPGQGVFAVHPKPLDLLVVRDLGLDVSDIAALGVRQISIVGAKVAVAVADVGDGPVKHVINTHWHFDHTDGNEWLNSRGAAVIAHENTRRHLSVDTRVEDWFHFTFPASPAGALPSTVVTDST